MKKITVQLSFSRKKEINRLRGQLEREGFPRLQMFLLVFITGGVAFLSSYLLLYAGLTSMWLRYLIVCLAAYCVFLLLLWLWLKTKLEDYESAPDASSVLPEINLETTTNEINAGGGIFGGGGSSGSFEETTQNSPALFNINDNNENPVVEAIGAASEAEEFAVPIIILILIITVVLSSAFIIYSAPVLFAELTVDSLLAAGLYKKFKGVDKEYWLSTAIKRTILPMFITTIVSVIAGYLLQSYVPKANSLGEILFILTSST